MNRVALVLLFLLFSAVSASADIKKCVGPSGELKYTDRECPAGYTLAGAQETLRSSMPSPDEPYICKFSNIISSHEIKDAIAEAESSLRKAMVEGTPASVSYWDDCLARLSAREETFHSEPAAQEEPKRDPVREWCTNGSFRIEKESIFFEKYDVIFSNYSLSACRQINILCSYSFTDAHYQTFTYKKDLHYGRPVKAGETLKVGTLEGGNNSWRCVIAR
jgi:hypothetical protein